MALVDGLVEELMMDTAAAAVDKASAENVGCAVEFLVVFVLQAIGSVRGPV